MLSYLIICRSLTYAQRTSQALARAGIPSRVQRAPKSVAGEGCTHGVRIGERLLPDALTVLKQAGLSPKRVYVQPPNEDPREVAL